MRWVVVLVALGFIAACSRTDADAQRVFEGAFGAAEPPANVVSVHGYRLERRRYFVQTDEMWRLHLSGSGAKDFVKQRWPDLGVATSRVFFQGTQTPWFAPGRDVKYLTFKSPSNPNVTVMLTHEAEDVYVAYDGL